MEEALQLNRIYPTQNSRTPNTNAWWDAVQHRDTGYDGIFVFGVQSTGIYCRPSCPARRPGRDQVRFYQLPEAAEQAGFRACRRCRPRDISARDAQVKIIQDACEKIKNNLEEPVTLSKLSGELGISPYHFQRVFKKMLGITPNQYAQACRSRLVKEQLKKGESIATAVYASGYSSSSRLYEKASRQFGMTPSEYKHGAPGARIHYAIADSFLGRLLVAATEKGICSIQIGSSDAELESSFQKEFPFAEIRKDASPLTAYIEQILESLSGQRPHLKLPLDIQGTAFQSRVWQELQKIPYGKSRSYSEIAKKVGRPTAVRAVARACATNPVAIVVPCHRVVREDGAFGGYRWGADRKKALLDREARLRNNKGTRTIR